VGRHYDEIICDDLVARAAMENARAGDWKIMQQVNRWINQLPPLLSINAKPFPMIRFIGTRWWANDSYDHIETAYGYGVPKKSFRFKVKLPDGLEQSRDIYRVGDLAVFRVSGIEDGKAVFPEIWPLERIEKVRYADPEFAACNILNDPSHAAVRTFQDTWLRYWQYIDKRTINYKLESGSNHYVATKELHRLISVDPAFTAGNTESARSAIVVLGTDMKTGKHLVLDANAQRSDPKDVITDILNLADTWSVNRVYVELAGQQLAFIDWLEREARIRGLPISVDTLKPGGRNKDMRIEGLVVPFKNGDLYLHASQSSLIDEEYRRYRPGATNRDVLDALAYAMEKAPKPVGGASGMSAKERSEKQLRTYHNRMGLSHAGR
jgi:hypothetical protein